MQNTEFVCQKKYGKQNGKHFPEKPQAQCRENRWRMERPNDLNNKYGL